MAGERITDLTKGIYRRIYGGFVGGKRINSVSIGAEAWFWRLHAIADDFGNMGPGLKLIRSSAAPIRNVTAKQVEGWMMELEHANLIQKYTADGDDYWSIVGFCDFQPAGKNGRRIQRFPLNGESGGIRVNPGESSSIQSPHSYSHSHTHSHQHQHSDQCAAAADDPPLSGEEEKRAAWFRKRPEWLPTGKPWIDKPECARLARLPLTQDHVDDAYRAGKDGRLTLDNPAGLVIQKLRKAAQMNGVKV